MKPDDARGVYARAMSIRHPQRVRRFLRLRDGDACWLCGRHVVDGLGPQDPERASIDHVVPVSDGGSDMDHNLRLAHASCNERRCPGEARPGRRRPSAP